MNALFFILKMCNIEQIILIIAFGVKDINDMTLWLNNFKELLPEEINNIFNEDKKINGAQAKEVFNVILEIFKSKINNKSEFTILAETYLSNYKDAKAQHNEFLQSVFLRQFIQIYIGQLNIEPIKVIDLEKEIEELPTYKSKGLILITITEEYKKIHSEKYKFWDEKLTKYLMENQAHFTKDKFIKS